MAPAADFRLVFCFLFLLQAFGLPLPLPPTPHAAVLCLFLLDARPSSGTPAGPGIRGWETRLTPTPRRIKLSVAVLA